MKIDKLAQELNFIENQKRDKNKYYKIVDGYIFSLIDTQAFALACSAKGFFTKNDFSFLNDFVDMKNVNIVSNFAKNDTLVISLENVEDNEYIEQCAILMKSLVQYFKDNDYQPYRSCRLCHLQTDEVISLGTVHEYGHYQCLEKYKQIAISSLNKNNDSPITELKSVLFCFLGSLVGLIPIYLCYFYLHSVSLFLIALLPILSFKGYQLGKATLDKKATIYTIVFSTFMVIVMMILIIMNDFTGSLTFEKIKSLIVDNSYDLMYTIVFYFLGLLLSLRFITNTNEKKKKEINKL